VAEQKRTVQDIQTNINLLSTIDFKKQELLFDRIKQTENEILSTKQDNIKLAQVIDNYNKTMALSKNWSDTNAKNLIDLTKKVQEFDSFDFDAEFRQLEYLNALDVETAELKRQLDAASILLHEKSKLFSKNDNELKKLATNECPYCQQNFADAKKKHSEICSIQETLKEEINAQQGLEQSISKKYQEQTFQLIEMKKKCRFTSNQLNTMKATLDNNRRLLEQAKQAENPFTCEELFLETDGIEQNNVKLASLQFVLDSNRQELKFDSERQMIQKQSELDSLNKQLRVEKTRVNPHTESLNQMKAMKLPETKEKELDELVKLMEHQDFLVKLLTKKDSFIRKSLLQKNLPLLNTRLKIYLEKMGLPHKVSFMENMSAQIKQFDTELEYNQLSSGQKARINLALCFAFRDVLQYRHGNVNFCMLDECLDVGLGNTGVQLAAKLIKDIAEEQKLSLFVISHRDEASAMFSRRLEIQYKNGFSTITVE
jgi:hypothetical protein